MIHGLALALPGFNRAVMLPVAAPAPPSPPPLAQAAVTAPSVATASLKIG